jgi:hypothetical protein
MSRPRVVWCRGVYNKSQTLQLLYTPSSLSSLMPAVDPPFTVYQAELTSLSHGTALWNPTPPNETYDNVSVGDVGYLDEGSFIRMFNVMLPWDHPWNRFLGRPMPYDPLRLNLFTNAINKDHFDKVDHYSRFVTVKTNAGKLQTGTPDE